MSDWIGRHPELGSEEYESSKLLMEELEKHGFQVERGVQGMETAFKAVFKGKPGCPCIARPGLLTEVKDAFERTEK
jgi:metal-dependent amidase/aminoacylase/carboxypeptidase family protein